MLPSNVLKEITRYRSFAAAAEADEAYYRALTGNERLALLLQLLNHDPERRLERVYRVVKFAPR